MRRTPGRRPSSTGAANVVGSTFGGGAIGDQNNLYAGYGEANFSRPSRLVLSSIYRTAQFRPWGWLRGKDFEWLGSIDGSDSPVRNRRWHSLIRIRTISSARSSDFAYLDTSNAGCNGSHQRRRFGQESPERVFQHQLLHRAANDQSGRGNGFWEYEAGTDAGPAQHNVDLSLSKTTRLTERMGLEFRAEFFNAFNSTQFGNPDTTFSDGAPAFGQITSTSVAPRIGQLALKLNF